MVQLVAVAKIVYGLGVWLASRASPAESPNLFSDWFYILQLTVFCTAAGLLLAGRGDERARALATLMLLFGTLFVDPLLRSANRLAWDSATWSIAFYHFEPIAFAPAFFWNFARKFPDALAESQSRIPPKVPFIVAMTVACLLVAANLIVPFTADQSLWSKLSAPFGGRNADGHLWEILMGLSLPSLFVIFAKVRGSPAIERRRFRLFMAGLIAGLLPLALDILAALTLPVYREYSRAPHRIRYVGVTLSLALLIIPVTTVYAVLVERVFGVRFFVRKALQYALARYTLLILLTVPAVALASFAYANKDRSISDLIRFRSPAGWLLLAATVIALGVARRPLLELLDRRFFREEYDARRILMNLVEGSRQTNSVNEQAALTVREIDRALHVTAVSILVKDAGRNVFVDPQHQLQSLPCDCPLATVIAGASPAFDLDQADSMVHRLPSADLEWLNQSRARLFVPLIASDRSLLGLIAIGEKLSETPFSAEDRQLLTTVGASVALAIEHRFLLESGPRSGSGSHVGDAESAAALQCARCGVLQDANPKGCLRCNGPLVPARLPAVLAATFAIEREIGRGGMGVVYRGRDLTLDRPVALKTLPRVSPSNVSRMRNEALAMAALDDPHLATIYSVETWRDSPVLVLEYLAGGTLADRLRMGPMSPSEVVSLGLAMSSALDALHRAGFLHRDIKPSNIGYTAKGVPKLLDFGLARLVTRLPRTVPPAPGSTHIAADSVLTTASASRPADTATQRWAGTAAYLSPEAIAMKPPRASFDLWSLAVTMFEALTSRNPFVGADLHETFWRICLARLPDPATLRNDCPAPLADFFRSALSLRIEDRPGSARAFHQSLSTLGLQ